MKEFDYENCQVIDIITRRSGIRFIHFLGYAYEYEGPEKNEGPWKFVSYIGAFYPLANVIKAGGISDFIFAREIEFKQQIIDLTEKELIEMYEKLNEGNKVIEIDESNITKDTINTLMDGTYVVFPLSHKL